MGIGRMSSLRQMGRVGNWEEAVDGGLAVAGSQGDNRYSLVVIFRQSVWLSGWWRR